MHSLEGLMRTSKIALNGALGVSISSTYPFLPWLVRHQSYLRNWFVVRSCGRAPSEVLTECKYQSPSRNLGETVSGTGVRKPKRANLAQRGPGLLMCRSIRTNEQLDGRRTVVISVTTMNRRF